MLRRERARRIADQSIQQNLQALARIDRHRKAVMIRRQVLAVLIPVMVVVPVTSLDNNDADADGHDVNSGAQHLVYDQEIQRYQWVKKIIPLQDSQICSICLESFGKKMLMFMI